MKKILSVILAILTITFALAACSEDSAEGVEMIENKDGVQIAGGTIETNAMGTEIIYGGVVTGEITLELYKNKAPITVDNFVSLVKSGFYDGLTFHRIISGFMIQGGDPEGTGMGGSSKTIKGEFAANGVANDIAHVKGVISMARGGYSMDSASSQFFICHGDAPHLDGNYAAFGKVIEGIEVVDALASVETAYSMSGEKSSPVTAQYIKTIKVIEEKSDIVKVKLTVGK